MQVRFHSGTSSYASPDLYIKIVEAGPQETLKKFSVIQTLCGIGIPVCMVMFMGTGVMTGMMLGLNYFPLVFIPMFLFAACGMGLGVAGKRKSAAKLVILVMDEIKAKDVTYFANMSYASYYGEAGALILTRKLIERNYLPEYEIVGELAVAKKTLRMTPGDLDYPRSAPAGMPAPQQVVIVNNRPAVNTNCNNCGAPADPDSKFCTHCGTRL